MSIQARERAIAWAKRIAADPRVVFLDTETTGLGDDAEVCDIGIVALDGATIVDQLVKPSRPIPPGATAVHGISDAMVANAPTWAAVSPLVAAAVSGRTVVIYNAGYDTGILRMAGRAIGQQIELHFMCAMLAFSEFKGTPGKFGRGFAWHKLDDAAAHFGIPPGGHRALADAETARRVVLAMAAADLVEPEPPAQAALFSVSNPNRFAR